MPIVYDAEKKGWHLVEPTPEEIEQIQLLGIQEFMHRFSEMVMERAIKAQSEEEQEIPDGVSVQ